MWIIGQRLTDDIGAVARHRSAPHVGVMPAASVLVQLGVLAHESTLPVAGAATARKVLDPSLPSNELIREARNCAEHVEVCLATIWTW